MLPTDALAALVARGQELERDIAAIGQQINEARLRQLRTGKRIDPTWCRNAGHARRELGQQLQVVRQSLAVIRSQLGIDARKDRDWYHGAFRDAFFQEAQKHLTPEQLRDLINAAKEAVRQGKAGKESIGQDQSPGTKSG